MSDAGSFRGRPLRVLHGCYEIAGQGMALAAGLNALGCEAHSLAYRVDWDGRRPDFIVELDSMRGPLARMSAMLGAFARWAPHFDLFHFHFGTSFFGSTYHRASFPGLADVPALKAMGKRVVFHFHGCEVRNRERMLGAHRLATCTECDPFCIPENQRWLLTRATRLADRVFFSTLDLAESVPDGVHLPLAIDAARWEAASAAAPLPDRARRNGVDGPVVIAHAPTHRLIKGTRHVEAAVDLLRREFPRLELNLIERRPWSEMPGLLAQCDILVDQVMMGWYGLLAIEGMAEGKAVVAYIRDDLRGRHPDLPVVSAEPATLAAVLRDLIRDPARREALGAAGAVFARARHDGRAVAQTLLGHYGEVLGRGLSSPA